MADTVSFQQAFFSSGESPQPLEDAIRRGMTYAGVHRFDFGDTINETFEALTNWDTDPLATAAVSSNRLSLTGGGSSIWYATTHTTEVTPSFVASYDLISGTGGFVFRGQTGTKPRPYYVVWSGGPSFVGVSRLDSARSETILTRLPESITAPSRVQVLVRYSLDSVDDDRKWLEVGLWMDGYNILGYAEDIGGTAYDWDGDEVGFAAWHTNNMIVDNFSISELSREALWVTLDIGQAPASGVTRAIASSRVFYHCRYDNTLRVWKPGDRSVDWTPEAGRLVKLDERHDLGRGTHVRVQAALHEVDAFHAASGQNRGHKFVLANDPNVMTESDAKKEADRVVHDEREMTDVTRFALPPNFLLEPMDRISYGGVDYRVKTVSFSMEMTPEGPRLIQQIEAQRYIALT